MIKKGVDPLENAIVEGSELKMEQTMDDLMDGGKVQPRTARFLRELAPPEVPSGPAPRRGAVRGENR